MNKVFIFGAGKRGKDLLALLNQLEVVDVVAFIDNDFEKQKSGVNGKKCLSIKEAILAGGQSEMVIVSSVNYEEIEQQLEKFNFKNVFCWSKKFPNPLYCIPVVSELSDYKKVSPFNHYESPYPNIVEIHKKQKELFDKNKEVLDIDFNVAGQLELLKGMEKLEVPQWPMERMEKYRYYYENSWFRKGSADALCYMIQFLKPENIIEVGSGYSTAVMLDTNENYFGNKIKIISIEPHAERLRALLKSTDNLDIMETKLQEISFKVFDRLKKNDILFIDSSHVSRIGSDVNYIFFEILPRLKKGVYIHFHDMRYPFVYPPEWVYEGRAYNEMYLMRAFLMNNKEYSVQLFGSLLEEKYHKVISDKLRGIGSNSLWIKKEK